MSAYARHEDPNRRAYVRSDPPPPTLLEALGPKGDTLIVLDFESYYSKDYSIRKCTTEAYVRGAQWETLGVGVKVGKTPAVWLEDWDFRRWAADVDWSRVILGAQQCQFEGLILSHRYDIRPAFFVDTMYLARYLHGPGKANLKTLGPMYGLGEKGDELENVKGKRRRDLTQAAWAKLGVYCVQDVNITAGLIAKMARQVPPEELWLIDTTVRMFTEPIFRGDLGVLQQAKAEEIAKKSKLLQRVARQFAHDDVIGLTGPAVEIAAKKILSSSDKFAALLRSLGVEPPMKPNDKGVMIPAFAKNDPGMQTLLEHPDEEIRDLAEARLGVKSTIIETRTQRIIESAGRGALPFYLKWCGAHTHRWSGGDKMNPQNFNRGGALRDAITVTEDLALVVVDSGQIEARVLPWLAGDQQLLDTFRRNDEKQRRYEQRVSALKAQGYDQKGAEKKASAEGLEEGDFYSDRGSALFLKKISKKETPIERQLSKNMILGLGFQMAWAKFGSEQLKGMLGSKPVQFTMTEIQKYGISVEAFASRKLGDGTCADRVDEMLATGLRLSRADAMVHFAVADHLVTLYRKSNGPITRYWRTMDAVLAAMTPDDGPEVRMTVGCLKVIRHGIVKPNGMVLHYPGLRKTGYGYVYLGGESGREHSKAYGGLLAENVTQSIARDIVAEQALWIRAKYANAIPGRRSCIGTTTHDEVVSVVPRAQADECLAYSLERLRTPPTWCRSLPLNASGGWGTSYGAVK